MIRNCITYRFEKGTARSSDLAPKLRAISLSGLLPSASAPERRRLEDFATYSRKERITPRTGTRGFSLFEFACEARVRRLTASGEVEMPFVPARFQVWLGKKIPWVVVFDAGRKLSAVANAMLGAAAADDTTSIKPVKLPKQVFEGLKDWTQSASSGQPGSISRVTLENVSSGKANFQQVVLRAAGLETSPIFRDFFGAALNVSNMTFVTPKLRAASRSINCKISYWGGITLYTADVLDAEIEELLGALDEQFAEL